MVSRVDGCEAREGGARGSSLFRAKRNPDFFDLRGRPSPTAPLGNAGTVNAAVLIDARGGMAARAEGDIPGARSAEHAARRTSSCALADHIASASISAYDAALASLPESARSLAPGAGRAQTVLASVVALDARLDPPLRVVSLGAGTKFLRACAIDADDARGERVRDCHAEVLARRGLKRFLYEQIRVAAAAGRRERERERDPSPDPDPEHNPSDPSAPWCVLEPCEGGWRVRDDCSLHLYATSAPCGNATVKRWAKGAKEKFRDDVGPFDVPRDLATHPPPSFGAKKDGQLAFLYKRDGAAGAASKDPGAERKDDARNPASSAGNPESSVAPGVVPAGTATFGRLLTCSDKIAVWSCVGVQGGLLLAPGLLTRPAYLASVVVGRKFGQAVLRRALCCRMRGFRGTRGMGRVPTEGADASGDAGAVAFALSHPAAMCTAIPFDLGTYAEGEGARFDNPIAVTAWLNGDGDTVAETIDGRTGEGTDGTAGVCRAALLRAHRSVAPPGNAEPVGDAREGGGPPGYRALKEAAGKHSGYAAAKRAAMAQPALWTLSDRHPRATLAAP